MRFTKSYTKLFIPRSYVWYHVTYHLWRYSDQRGKGKQGRDDNEEVEYFPWLLKEWPPPQYKQAVDTGKEISIHMRLWMRCILPRRRKPAFIFPLEVIKLVCVWYRERNHCINGMRDSETWIILWKERANKTRQEADLIPSSSTKRPLKMKLNTSAKYRSGLYEPSSFGSRDEANCIMRQESKKFWPEQQVSHHPSVCQVELWVMTVMVSIVKN